MQKRLLKQNNKGFTLVELIVAIAILAVASAPILYSFVTSARIEKKGRDVNAATVAAQNIQEIVISAETEKALNGSCFPEGFADNVKKTETGLQLLGVEAGGKSFDAVVKFDESVYEELNQASVPSFAAMDAVFVQPMDKESGNTDAIAWEAFSADGNEGGALNRTITIDIIKDKEHNKAYAKATYHYQSGNNRLSAQTYVYDLLRDGFSLDDGNALDLYLMYFPWSHGTSSIEYIVINNVDDVEANIYLVRQESEESSTLQLKQMQSGDYDRNAPTTNVFFDEKTQISLYQVFTGKIFYYKVDLKSLKPGLIARGDNALLYGVDISLYEPDTIESAEAIYTLSANKRG